MRMTIERMHIQNFKGIRELTISFGEITRIRGMNGTGKTTIPDAFSWVLWNKDSRGNAPGSYDFREKPLDRDGNEIHNLDTTVELFCWLDNQPFNLRRTQRENWVKKRGSTDAVFQGNVSTYWINDVETKQSDFKARIAQISSEDVFRLVGSLSAFNALDWKKRREQLLALADRDVDTHLLQTDEYRPLADECAQRGVTVEDIRKILADQRRRSNDELRMIPVRIDEARKALPDISEQEIADAEYIVHDTTADIERIDGYIADARAAGSVAGLRRQILALETEAVSLKRTISDEHRAQKRQLEQERDTASSIYNRTVQMLSDTKARMERDAKQLEAAIAERDKLRGQYTAAYERQYVAPELETICPTCKQPLPAEAIQAAADAAKAAFDAERKNRLSEIKQAGKAKGEEIARLQKSIEQFEAEIQSTEDQIKGCAMARDEAYEKIKALHDEPDYSSEPRIAELQQQIDDLKAQLQSSPDEKIRGYERRKAELNVILERNRAVIARRDAAMETRKRIAALEQQQKEKAARVAELEQLIALAEKFVQDRCSALEESINDRFPNIRWKLFERQINGGITDTCQAYIPCESGLVSYGSANTASQVNADIEIINVLSKHYGVQIPLFADNSERVNLLEDTESQLITLAVSTDEELRIETLKEAS